MRNMVHRSRTREESAREAALFFFDHPGPDGEDVHPGPAGIRLVNPMERRPGAEALEGVFFEERLFDLLRGKDLVPAGAEVIGYREEDGPVGEVRMTIVYREDGKRHLLEIPASEIG